MELIMDHCFVSLSDEELITNNAGSVEVYVPLVAGAFGVKGTYSDKAAGYTAAWMVGGAISGATGGIGGMAIGATGGFVAQSICSTIDGEITWRPSFLGY